MKMNIKGKLFLLATVFSISNSFATNNDFGGFIIPEGLSEEEQMQIALAMSMSQEAQVVTDGQRLENVQAASAASSGASYGAIVGKTVTEAVDIYVDGLGLNSEVAGNLKDAIKAEAKSLEDGFSALEGAEKAAAIEATILGFLFKDGSVVISKYAKNYLELNKGAVIKFDDNLLKSDNLCMFIEGLDKSFFNNLKRLGYYNVATIVMNRLASSYKIDAISTFINELKAAFKKLPSASGSGMDDSINFNDPVVLGVINKINMQIRYVIGNDLLNISYESLVNDLIDAAK